MIVEPERRAAADSVPRPRRAAGTAARLRAERGAAARRRGAAPRSGRSARRPHRALHGVALFARRAVLRRRLVAVGGSPRHRLRRHRPRRAGVRGRVPPPRSERRANTPAAGRGARHAGAPLRVHAAVRIPLPGAPRRAAPRRQPRLHLLRARRLGLPPGGNDPGAGAPAVAAGAGGSGARAGAALRGVVPRRGPGDRRAAQPLPSAPGPAQLAGGGADRAARQAGVAARRILPRAGRQ